VTAIDQVIYRFVDATTVELTFGRGSDPNRWDEVGRLEVHFREADAEASPTPVLRPDRVSLSLADGLSAGELHRFAWARWLAVADAAIRSLGLEPSAPPAADPWYRERQRLEFETQRQIEVQRAMLKGLGQKVLAYRRKPGRRAHGDDFYQSVADAYLALLAGGERAPTARLAAEWNYSRNTVAGWVHRARQRGFLPPARKGRAG